MDFRPLFSDPYPGSVFNRRFKYNSIASLNGFITLFVIAIRNGILMVSHYQYLRREGKEFVQAIRQEPWNG